ncbi:MAG: pyruvate formate lyase family protein [Syntrophales bacterium]|nr:pyruvate formate lyase family protein [Syntrophales bacterium]
MSAITQALRKKIVYKSAVTRTDLGQKAGAGQRYRADVLICTDRARLLTESYLSTDGQPEVLRRARALENILDQMTIYIDPDERIVGNFARSSSHVNLFPELAVDWVHNAIQGAFVDRLGEADKKTWQFVYDYWKGRCLDDRVKSLLPDAIRDYVEFNNVCMANSWRHSIMSVSLDYEKLFRVGLRGLIEAATERLRELKMDMKIHPTDYVNQRYFREAVVIALRAAIRFAHRFADLAEEQAERETIRTRQEQLRKIAEVCRRVPEDPPRTVQEGLQAFWFCFLVNRLIETRGQGIGVRFDQLLYPLYKRDLESGSTTREEAQELMEFLLIKLDACGHLQRPELHDVGAGSSMYQTLTLGGTTLDGMDATNEFSFIMLDAAIAMKTVHTNYALRYHPTIRQDFISRSIDLLRTGVGYPAFFNDYAHYPFIINRGIPMEDARNYAIRGCVSWLIPGKNSHNHRASSAMFNFAKCLEFALNCGKDVLTGKQLGSHTPAASEFHSLNDLKDAFYSQLEYLVGKITASINLGDEFYARSMPLPFTSALVEGCISRGQDCNSWTYNSREDIICTGLTNVADSFAAIKKFVYEEKVVTLAELNTILRNDWQGHEDLRQMFVRKAPKFGNDDDAADDEMRELHHRAQSIVRSHKNWWGDPWDLDGSMAASYYIWGLFTAATPDGRHHHDSLADAVLSPSGGFDVKGPTATLRSMGKVTPTWPELANQKFMPQFLEDEYKPQFAAYLKTWADFGISHIQFNVVDRETLLDAQACPEKYQNLIVRVAGYSAFYVDLSKGVQDDIIKRTSQGFRQP